MVLYGFLLQKKSFTQFNYEISSQVIDRCYEMKDLGIIFDSKFSFKAHIHNVVQTATRTLNSILGNCRGFGSVVKLRSKLEYDSIIWHPIYHVNISYLESVQRRLVKYLDYKCDGTYPLKGTDQDILMSIFNIIDLQTRSHKLSVSFLYKLLNNRFDCILLFNQIKFVIPRINARHTCTFYCERPNGNMLTRAPIYHACNLFNTMCNESDPFADPLGTILARIK